MKIPPSSRWLAVGETVVIFTLFALQGACPAPESNEPHYLVKAAYKHNPEWSKGDFFLESADAHHVFYFTFGWLTRWMTLPAAAWTGRLITWFLLAWAWRRLSSALVPRPGWAILTAALFAMLMRYCPMAGEWVIGGVEAKGFAYVFVFFGLEALVRGRWNRCWLCFGAAMMFHVLVGGWAALAAGVTWLTRRNDRPSVRTMLPGLLGGLLLALPGLIPALALNWNCDAETLRQANVIYVFERLRHHLDIFQMQPALIIRFVLLAVLFLLICRRGEAQAKGAGSFCPSGPVDSSQEIDWSSFSRLKTFVQSVLSLMLIGVVVNFAGLVSQPATAGLLKYFWYRLADVAVPLGVALTAGVWIAGNRKRAEGKFWLTVAILLVGWHFGNLGLVRCERRIPRADRLPHPAAWRAACDWIRENTPPHARFLTPRRSQTFKWYTGRAEVVTWKDVPQNAKGIVEWRRRLQEIYATGRTEPGFRRHANLSALGALRLQQLGKKYQARYAIIKRAPAVSVLRLRGAAAEPKEIPFTPLKLPLVFENEGYVIYRLSE